MTVVRTDRRRQASTVTYTLAGMQAQPDKNYRLEGHLEPSFTVFTRENKPERRGEILVRLFGPQAAP